MLPFSTLSVVDRGTDTYRLTVTIPDWLQAELSTMNDPEDPLRITTLLVLSLRYLNRPVLSREAFENAYILGYVKREDMVLFTKMQLCFLNQLCLFNVGRTTNAHRYGWEVVQIYPTVMVVSSFRRALWDDPEKTVASLIHTPNKRNTGWKNTPLSAVATL